MRLRHTLGAALGALVLAVSVPSSAHAVEGSFDYHYGDPANPSNGQLLDPKVQYCYNTTELAGTPQVAFGARNELSSTVVIYADEECTGTKTTLKPGGEVANDITFKSVYIVGSN
ncbi:hypothetical protein ACGFRG_23885 [Streptomyces sp. NPDC048696]|uniref:hypothetical protein n=1 Tax=Streptomyces sp. NPDC048696 TaxID=3365585 RepID=UPI003713D833